MKKSSCVVVLSGGQDSTTCLFWAKESFDVVHAVTFDYGQRHRLEIEAATKVAKMANVDSHEIIAIPSILESASPLLSDNELEQYQDAVQMDRVIGDRVEKTFVPMRNTLFLTVAANRAVALGSNVLITGVCGEDNANYPDCTQDFILKLEQAFKESLRNDGFIIITPLIDLKKSETCKLAYALPYKNEDSYSCWEALAYSHTSYDGKYPPTDMNHANVLRAQGFEEAELPDPLVLRAVREKLMELPLTKNYDSYR